MKISGTEVLLVGRDLQDRDTLTASLQRWGFRCHFAGTVITARQLLNSIRVDLVLSSTRLPDGTGFGLVAALAGLPVTAFLCLRVEETCFWLPAIDGGRDCLGLPALRPPEFADELMEMLQHLPPATAIN